MGRMLIQRRRNTPDRSLGPIREFSPGETVSELERSELFDHRIQHRMAEPLQPHEGFFPGRPILDW